jgi:hypothetical protein
MRKKHKKVPLPVVDDRQYIEWLPRDIRLGWNSGLLKGSMLYGFCETTETWQLWEALSGEGKPLARFVGFVVSTC